MTEPAIGQQRSFVRNLPRQSAQQIRESATATVKAMAEQQVREGAEHREGGREYRSHLPPTICCP